MISVFKATNVEDSTDVVDTRYEGFQSLTQSGHQGAVALTVGSVPRRIVFKLRQFN